MPLKFDSVSATGHARQWIPMVLSLAVLAALFGIGWQLAARPAGQVSVDQARSTAPETAEETATAGTFEHRTRRADDTQSVDDQEGLSLSVGYASNPGKARRPAESIGEPVASDSVSSTILAPETAVASIGGFGDKAGDTEPSTMLPFITLELVQGRISLEGILPDVADNRAFLQQLKDLDSVSVTAGSVVMVDTVRLADTGNRWHHWPAIIMRIVGDIDAASANISLHLNPQRVSVSGSVSSDADQIAINRLVGDFDPDVQLEISLHVDTLDPASLEFDVLRAGNSWLATGTGQASEHLRTALANDARIDWQGDYQRSTRAAAWVDRVVPVLTLVGSNAQQTAVNFDGDELLIRVIEPEAGIETLQSLRNQLADLLGDSVTLVLPQLDEVGPAPVGEHSVASVTPVDQVGPADGGELPSVGQQSGESVAVSTDDMETVGAVQPLAVISPVPVVPRQAAVAPKPASEAPGQAAVESKPASEAPGQAVVATAPEPVAPESPAKAQVVGRIDAPVQLAPVVPAGRTATVPAQIPGPRGLLNEIDESYIARPGSIEPAMVSWPTGDTRKQVSERHDSAVEGQGVPAAGDSTAGHSASRSVSHSTDPATNRANRRAVLRRLPANAAQMTFDLGSVRLLPNTRKALDNIIATLQVYQDVKVALEVSVTDYANSVRNLNLSIRRAQAFNRYLLGRGIDPGRFSVSGVGDKMSRRQARQSARQRADQEASSPGTDAHSGQQTGKLPETLRDRLQVATPEHTGRSRVELTYWENQEP